MQKVMELENEDLATAFMLVDALYVAAYVVAIVMSHSLTLTQPGWHLTVCLLGILPSGIVRMTAAALRWIYGYACGVGGVSRWKTFDTVYMAFWSIELFYATLTVVAIPWSAGVVVPQGYKICLLAGAIVDIVVLFWLLSKAWKDYSNWKRIEFHGVFAWSFQRFVEERFKAASDTTTYADF